MPYAAVYRFGKYVISIEKFFNIQYFYKEVSTLKIDVESFLCSDFKGRANLKKMLLLFLITKKGLTNKVFDWTWVDRIYNLNPLFIQ